MIDRKPTRERLQEVLYQAWSLSSSSLWTEENPARGQCGVTALVVHDWWGGEILKTETPGGWHFYNRLDGERIDFTASQFSAPIRYADIPSSREEAFADTNAEQYGYLKERVARLLADE
ncbi:hypothetical protein G3578_12715 [Brevibacillus sp. SYP-B805]|uniref:YunG family protein n=1 Tax=Brevibacillus sp. SYP-B805 TaxID=1578199 RepID=UPI0013EA4DB6|nr:hypothetical protein [Brevibacillus sp. SYP-B805]NGQ96020.1 hypothetical protein [Brevibacillus sp. SYP-B805]